MVLARQLARSRLLMEREDKLSSIYNIAVYLAVIVRFYDPLYIAPSDSAILYSFYL